jgi:uncharacterized UBP type Zn finger protein
MLNSLIHLLQRIGINVGGTCYHVRHIHRFEDLTPSAEGCEECLAMGDEWVHLRICMTCGHVGCCDNSKNKHATKHHEATGHPIIRSYEPGEDWLWCYPHRTTVKQPE